MPRGFTVVGTFLCRFQTGLWTLVSDRSFVSFVRVVTKYELFIPTTKYCARLA